MTRLDILLLALPDDAVSANLILDGLHQAGVAGVHPTRIEAIDPQSFAWRSVTKRARSVPAVLFCWSSATSGEEAKPMRELAAELVQKGTAIGVELDAATTPPEMAGASVYPAYGWRCRPGTVLRFLYGDMHRMQIAVAAQRKVSGQDPPPPAAFWQLIRARAWVALVGIFAAIGILWNLWSIAIDDRLAQLRQPEIGSEFESARDAKDCAAMRSFAAKHPGSPWRADVTEFLANCHKREVIETRTDQIDLPVAASSRREAEVNGRSLCATHTNNAGGQLISAKITSFDQAGLSQVRCTLTIGTTAVREVYGNAER